MAILLPCGGLNLGDDADNIRVDPRNGHVVVGYGEGGLAIIDPATRTKLQDIKLPGHPESFQIDPQSNRAYVNVPDAGQIAVVDLATGRQVASWTVPGLAQNFPMAIGDFGATIATVFRSPPRLVFLDSRTGAVTGSYLTCADADDVFFDAKRQRVYVSCGAGGVDVFSRDATDARHIARIQTSSGARTSLFAPELDELYIGGARRSTRGRRHCRIPPRAMSRPTKAGFSQGPTGPQGRQQGVSASICASAGLTPMSLSIRLSSSASTRRSR